MYLLSTLPQPVLEALHGEVHPIKLQGADVGGQAGALHCWNQTQSSTH